MRILHFDCSMGAAGDMLTASLLELFDDREAVLAELNALGIPGVVFDAHASEKCGVVGTHLHVLVRGEEEGDERHHTHEYEHHHDHDHEHTHGHGHEHTHDHDHEHTHDHDHEHTHDHDHEHTHDHDHEHTHDHDHEHTHDHDHEHPHGHRSPTDVAAIVGSLNIPEAVRTNVLAVYDSIAKAESAVHGVSMDEIHFHEVGSMDAIADVTAFSYLLCRLNPDRVTATPIHVGSGRVKCAHGILPVPAPATARLLEGIPIYGGSVEGELCTPTGAALLRHYVNSFGPMPVLSIEKIGYGMGKKDFPAANCVRAFLAGSGELTEEMIKLECNLDDMTAEDLGYACAVLREAGAPEVFSVPVQMKKDRPGVLLTVICRPEQRETMVKAILRHTGTIGVRETALRRYVLSRREETSDTAFGPVRRKISEGYGVRREKWEYDDLARIARENGLSIGEIRERLKTV